MGATTYAYVKLTTTQVCVLIEACNALTEVTPDNGMRGNLAILRNKLQGALPMPSQSGPLSRDLGGSAPSARHSRSRTLP